MPRVHKGDNVLVTAGKDRGKQGEVIRVIPDTNRVVVKGVNRIKRHRKAQPGVRQGGIIEAEGPINLSNVSVVCKHCGKPIRVGYKFLEDGRKVRSCRKCGETLD